VLATVAGVFDALKGMAGSDEPVVDPYDAGLEPGGDWMRAGKVGCLDAGGEAVPGAVGQLDGVVLGVERLHGQDRTEDLLPHRV
jgi:hypothetical protein